MEKSNLGRYSKNPTLLNELLLTDYIRKLEPLFQMGWYINPQNGKLALRPGAHGIQHNTNWIHTNPDPDRRCRFYQLIHEHCDFIPKRCLSCWKVVARPQSLFQLIQIYELQMDLAEENPSCWCKCGYEERVWVSGHYGAYFYCNSEEVGLARLETVKNAIEKHVLHGDKIDVFLKRYCTEFELKHGDSFEYERSAEADVMETAIFEGSYIEKLADPQPQSVKDHIMSEWIINANGDADPTAKLFNANKPLYTPPRRYDKEVVEQWQKKQKAKKQKE